MDEFINVRSVVDDFMKQHPELKQYEVLLLELARDVHDDVGCSWPSCADGVS